MNKVKNRIKRGFTVVPNDLINDISISPVARFLFVYMASKPDDWDFHQAELMKATGIKDPRTFRRHMAELTEPGWITRTRSRTDGAQFSSYDYTLHEKPECKKCTMEPECKISTMEKMHSAKNAYLTNKDLEQINTTKEKRGSKQPRFVPPALEEIISYLQLDHEENFARREAEKFRDHFESNGWKVGGRAAMKDWKAAARNWMRRAEKYKPHAQDNTQRFGAATHAEIEKALAIRRARREAV